MITKLKWLTALVAVLVIVNIALVAFIWLQKGEAPKPGGPKDARNYLVKELSLNDSQIKAFDSLRKQHFERMHGYKDGMRDLKGKLFDQLRWPRNAMADSLTQKIGVLQSKIDLETFEHFASLRSLLTKSQAEKFDNTILEVLQTMAPRPESDQGPPPPDLHSPLPPNDPPKGGPPH